MRKYCFYFGIAHPYGDEFSCIAVDNFVALYFFAEYLFELKDFNFWSYDVYCYCMIDDEWHNFTDMEIKFFRKCLGVDK